jgi:cation diffusion facilitator family transporter
MVKKLSLRSVSVNNKKVLSDKQVVGTSLAVSISDVVLNFIVALYTGSAVILAQSLQGLSDVTTAGVLYHGVKRAKKEADDIHPLGFGREIFFWSLLAAIIMFAGTGALSFYFGYQQFTNPEPIEHTTIAFIMLTFGLATNLYAFSKSVTRLKQNTRKKKWVSSIRHSSLVDTKITLTVDFLGSSAAFLGLISLILYAITNNVRFDGIGAMAVGLVTMIAAVFVIIDIHGFIVGRSVPVSIIRKITKATLSVKGVQAVVDIYAFYIGTDKLFAVVEVHVDDLLTTDHIEGLTDKIKEKIHHALPNVHRVQIEIETPDNELVDTETKI